MRLLLLIFLLPVFQAHAIERAKTVDEAKAPPHGVAAIITVDKTRMMSSFCSGVFVSDRLLLTARHCADSGTIVLTQIDNKAIDPMLPVPFLSYLLSFDLDLALVLFPAGTAKDYVKLNEMSFDSNVNLEMRGYAGGIDLPTPLPGTAVERVTQVPLFANQGDILKLRLHSTESYATSGDSGGPIFTSEGKLAGILITYEMIDAQDEWHNQWIENTAVNLSSPKALRFLSHAKAFFNYPQGLSAK